MHKIGVIGNRESVLGFKAVGLETFPCNTAEEAGSTLSKIVKEGYAIIFITETYAKELNDLMNRYKYHQLPVIVPIPGADGNHGVGFDILKKSVEHAVGADILFGGEK